MEREMENKNAGLYVHIPYCVRKCLYCDFCSYPGQLQTADTYVDALLREAEGYAELFRDRAFDTVFFGGGTPSLLTGDQMGRLLDGLRSRLPVRKDAEISMEANPGTITEEKLDAYLGSGVNRISFGVQAIQDPLLERLGRIHRFRDASDCLAMAKKAGFQRINLDFMTGLPGQGEHDLAESLAWAVDSGVGHISLYSLIVEDGTPFFETYEKGELPLPDEDWERDVFREACDYLHTSGLNRYEISNFARPGEECRHNLHYWRREPYLGLGVAAASCLGQSRWKNDENLQSYLESCGEGRMPEKTEETVSKDDLVFETVMLALRLKEGLNFADFRKRYGEETEKAMREIGEFWMRENLAVCDDVRLFLTDRGMDVQNTLLVQAWEKLDECRGMKSDGKQKAP